MAGSTRWLIGLLAVVTVLAVAALVLSQAGERPADLAASSPEGVVQRYLTAIAEDDEDALRGTLHSERLRDCRDGEPELDPGHRSPDFTAELRDVERDGDEAEVTVRITEHDGEPPFDSGGYDHTEVFELARDDGAWRITGESWPYLGCPGGVR